jgi:hypothetical protein
MIYYNKTLVNNNLLFLIAFKLIDLSRDAPYKWCEYCWGKTSDTTTICATVIQLFVPCYSKAGREWCNRPNKSSTHGGVAEVGAANGGAADCVAGNVEGVALQFD